MSKRSGAVEDSIPCGMLEALGAGNADAGLRYLTARPSYARVLRKLEVNGWEGGLTRGQYALLYQPIKTLRTLQKQTQIDTTGLEYVGQDINAWSQTPGGQIQVKARYVAKKPPGPELVPATPVAFAVTATRPKRSGMSVLAIPDMHFGFAELKPGKLETLHDERAAAVMLAIARECQPETIVVLGDLLDLAPFSRFVVDPRYTRVSQHAIQAAYAFLASLRDACPRAKIVMLEGNHEARISKHLSQQAPELVGLTLPENQGERNRPLLSLPYLLRLDELKIQYVGPYGTHWWHEGVRYMHGELIGNAGGLTAAKLLSAYPEPVICGHVHRAELAFRTHATADGPRQVWAMSCGTGARIDGIVPGHAHPDWQHAVGVVWFGGHPGIVVIRDGMCSIDGRLFSAEKEGASNG